MDSIDYHVEKVIGKRIKNEKVCFILILLNVKIFRELNDETMKPRGETIFQIQYRVKWTSYPTSENSWVDFDWMYECDEIVNLFEKSQFTAIIGNILTIFSFLSLIFFCHLFQLYRCLELSGAKRANGAIEYAISVKNTPEFIMMTSNDVITMWPDKLVEYLEKAIEFSQPVRSGNENITNGKSVDLHLPEILIKGLLITFFFCESIFVTKFDLFYLACSNFDDNLTYLVDVGNSLKVFPAHVLKQRFQKSVVQFLESNFHLSPGNPTRILPQLPTTRKFRKQVIEEGIHLDVKVKIVRDLSLEIFLLTGTPRALIQLIQTFRNVPIGARGRKRNMKNLLVIAIAPNPDNRKLTSAVDSPGTQAAVSTQPAKRTYARLASTPFPRSTQKRTQTRLMSTPFALQQSPPSPSATPNVLSPIESPSKSQLTAVDYDVNFGTLHYSDSE